MGNSNTFACSQKMRIKYQAQKIEKLNNNGNTQFNQTNVDKFEELFNVTAPQFRMFFAKLTNNGQMIWLSCDKVNNLDAQALITTYNQYNKQLLNRKLKSQKHQRKLHINIGVHGNEEGNITDFSKPDINIKALKSLQDLPNFSIHKVTNEHPPVYPPNVDILDAWSWSEVSFEKLIAQGVQQIKPNPNEFSKVKELLSKQKYKEALENWDLQTGKYESSQEGIFIKADCCQKFADKALSKLELKLYNKNISNDGIIYIAQGISSLANLSQLELWLWNNKITMKGSKYLKQGLQKCANLTDLVLKLDNNKISDEGSKLVCQGLSNLFKLNSLTLTLKNIDLSDNGARGICSELSKLVQLRVLKLELCQNKLSDQGLLFIGQELSSLVNLTELQLCINKAMISEKQQEEVKKKLQNNLKKCQLTFEFL